MPAFRICWLCVISPMLLSVPRAVSDMEENDGEAPDDDLDQDTLSPEQVHKLHRHVDLNGDGKTSVQEILEFAADMRSRIAASDVGVVMEEMDLNKDGVLDFEELVRDFEQWSEGEDESAEVHASKRALEKAKFVAADLNGDRVLNLKELPGLLYPETNERVMELVTRSVMQEKDTDQDGQLSPEEFWGTEGADQDLAITEEENIDFRRLDADGNGKLSVQELKTWESGSFHTEDAMKKLFDIADKDSDMHVSAAELESAREAISGTDAQYHLLEWAEHFEL